MGFSLEFNVDGSVILLNTSSNVYLHRFDTLYHYQSYCGWLRSTKEDQGIRTLPFLSEWKDEFINPYEILSGHGTMFCDPIYGEADFNSLSKKARRYLKKTFSYGSFNWYLYNYTRKEYIVLDHKPLESPKIYKIRKWKHNTDNIKYSYSTSDSEGKIIYPGIHVPLEYSYKEWESVWNVKVYEEIITYRTSKKHSKSKKLHK